ncbi:MAG: DUF4276 family protein [Gammaproteobacteria bacterium]|nr:DUF4276 family protein [Gammaproteobacteria bacterium]
MIRIHVICEGQTEEMFINEVLSPFFDSKEIYLQPALIGKPGHKGGNVKFERLLIDIQNRLNDKTAYCTTFFDFYGLPENFPGKKIATTKTNIIDKASCVLDSLIQQLEKNLGKEPLSRFIPYIQMYEFEGLLFSDSEKLARGIDQLKLATKFKEIRDQFNAPEEINNSPDTAPSKRIGKIYPAYEKPIHGSLAAIEIGLSVIRRECLHFDAWLTRLEKLQPI